LKVLFLSIYDPYEHIFGAGNHLRNLSETLRDLGCEIHILIPGSKTNTQTKNGLYLHTVKTNLLRSQGNGIVFSATSYRSVNRICNDYKIDIIHSQSPSGFGYSIFRNKKRPFVVTLHGTSFGELSAYSNVPFSNFSTALMRDAILVQPLFALFTSIEYKRANKIIAVSKYLTQEAKNFYHLPKEKIVPIYNGVNLPELKSSSSETEEGQNVLFVGRLIWRKGAQYLIDAFPQVLSAYPDAKITIVGSGEQKKFLQEKVKQLKIDDSVQFLSNVPSDRLWELYSQADVFIQPSLYEPLGITVLEAMSFSKPVIASRVGGIPELVQNGVNGLLVEPGNTNQLVEATKRLFSDPSLGRKYGQNAREKVEAQYTWKKIGQKTLQLYEELLVN
jgi:glycosyltransferase involved in cell wall biosynthesis